MSRVYTRPERGFLLVQVVVAVTIIAILSSAVLFSVSSVRARARDAQRYSDLQNVQLALRMYKETYGQYPSTGGTWWTVCLGGRGVTGGTGYIANLAPNFIPVLPTEPAGCTSTKGNYKGYIYQSNGTDYKFATDWSAEQGVECKVGGKYADYGGCNASGVCRVHTGGPTEYFCSVHSPGAKTW